MKKNVSRFCAKFFFLLFRLAAEFGLAFFWNFSEVFVSLIDRVVDGIYLVVVGVLIYLFRIDGYVLIFGRSLKCGLIFSG